jgi:hypothetical protein
MGGAFVAVSNDIHSCYWNPAGLSDITERETTYMQTLNSRDDFNYQEWFAAGIKVGEKSGVGVSHIHTIDWQGFVDIDQDGERDREEPYIVTDGRWLVLSVGGYGEGRLRKTSFGMNIRRYTSSLMKSYGLSSEGADFEGFGMEKEAIGIDIGVIHRVGDVSFGLLLQNLNEPKFEFESVIIDQRRYFVKITHSSNIRFGIAWRPDRRTLFAADVYNFDINDWYSASDFDQTSFRIGFEREIVSGLFFRCGMYGKSFSTVGFGIKRKLSGFLLALDWALLAAEDKGFHIISCTAKY